MHRYTIKLRFLAAALAAGFFSACSDQRLRDGLRPPVSAPLSRSIGFAVIDASYAQIRDRPAADAVVLGFCRQGAILAVSERRSVSAADGTSLWLLIDGDEPGWIAAGDARIFDNRAKAETAAAGGR